MLGQRVSAVLNAGFLGLVLLAAPVLTHAADVSDAGDFFSAAAVEKANSTIRDIEKKTGHEIRIETYATVPTEKVDEVAKMDKKQKDEFTHRWVNDRANATKAKGFLLLICKEPHRVETFVSERLKEKGFTKADRDQVKDVTIAALSARNFDGALHDSVAKLGTIYSRLGNSPHAAAADRPNRAENVPHQAVPVRQARTSWMPVILILGVVLFGIFILSTIARMFGGGARGYGGGPAGFGPPPGPGGGYAPGYGPPPGYGGAGGGGFMKGLAGGIFGAMAGNWLYDSFGGHSAHAHDNTIGNTDPLSGSRTLGDDSPSGGGWSDNDGSSGGDWSDSGGGGGGDFGGGGGDFGGGGDSGGDF